MQCFAGGGMISSDLFNRTGQEKREPAIAEASPPAGFFLGYFQFGRGSASISIAFDPAPNSPDLAAAKRPAHYFSKRRLSPNADFHIHPDE
jgi:hypothetical protein